MKTHNHRGIILMVIAALCFAGMTIFIRLAADHEIPGPNRFDVWETMFVRSSVMLVACLVAMGPRALNAIRHLPPATLNLLAFRGIVGALSMAAGFYAALHLPLAVASLFTNSSVIFTGLFCYLILSEAMNPLRLMGSLVGFCGVTLIILNGVHSSVTATDPGPSLWTWIGGSTAGPLAAMAYTSVRKMKQVSTTTIVLSLALGGVVLSCAAGLVSGVHWPRSMQTWVDLGISAFFALGGQYFMTRAFQCGDAAVVSVGQYTGPVFAVLAGVVLFQEHLNGLQLLGVFMVISVGFLSLWQQKPQ